MEPNFVLVTAAEGRLCPIPTSEASAPGGILLKCESTKVYRLAKSSYVRRRILAGDLEYCTPVGDRTKDALAAAAPKVLELADDGSVANLVAKPWPGAPAPAVQAPALAHLEHDAEPAPLPAPPAPPAFDVTDTHSPAKEG